MCHDMQQMFFVLLIEIHSCLIFFSNMFRLSFPVNFISLLSVSIVIYYILPLKYNRFSQFDSRVFRNHVVHRLCIIIWCGLFVIFGAKIQNTHANNEDRTTLFSLTQLNDERFDTRLMF